MIRALRVQSRQLVVPSRRADRPTALRSGPGSPPRRGVAIDRTLLTIVAVLWGVAVAWLAFGAGDADMQVAVSDIGQMVLDLLAAVIILRAARHVDVRRVRIGWALIGVAMLAYVVADGMWVWMDVVTGDVAAVSLADVFYLSFYPIVVAALLIFQSASAVRRETLRLAIDSLIVLIGGGIVVWHTLFRPALESLDPDPMVAALALGYPMFDLVLLFGVAATALRRPANVDARALTALVAGLGLMFVGDVGYGQLNLIGSSDVERWPDAIYMTSTLLMALAGYFQAHPRAATDNQARMMSRWLLVLPYAGLAAGYWVLVTLAHDTVTGELAEVLYGAIALTALVLFRQALVLRENSRLLSEQTLLKSEARFRTLSQNASDVVILVDRAGVVTYAAPTVRRVLGVDDSHLVGRPISSLVHADDVERVGMFIADMAAGRPVVQPAEWRVWDATGVWRQVETIAANLLDDPSVAQIVLTLRDVRERKSLERQLTQVALHDLLTGLPNRSLFHDRVGQALASAARADHGTTVLSIGLDGFTRVNESLGHAVGDQALQEVARRIRAAARDADTCARLGGDEFGLLFDGDITTADTIAAAERILAAVREPMDLAESPIHLTASLGISAAAPTETVTGSLLRRAETARSVARHHGGNQAVIFEPEMQQAVETRFELESELRRAIDNGEFVLNYQPIVDLESGELVAAEALIRWEHPTHGRIAPTVFIPIAEESGMIVEIGAWVLRTACAEAARWAGLSPGRIPRVSINLSAHQLADPQLVWTVQAALAHASASPSWVTLELTESMLMQNSSAHLERLHALRALGVQIAIDDFGTGYSSLAYLEHFPVTHIKVDRSFVTPLNDPRKSAGVVRAIIEIGGSLSLTTVAEGIETPAELLRLRELGCALGQGFLFSRPLEPDAMADLVAHQTGPAFARQITLPDPLETARMAPSAPDRTRSHSRHKPNGRRRPPVEV